MYPTEFPSSCEPWSQPSTRNPQYSGPGTEFGRGQYQSSREYNIGVSSSPSGVQSVPFLEEHQDTNPDSRPQGTRGASEQNSAVSEVRFTSLVSKLPAEREGATGPQAYKTRSSEKRSPNSTASRRTWTKSP